jgi:hypothetical protein
MPVVSSLVAKVLAYADALAVFFVTTTVISAPLNGQCANIVLLNAQFTPCGASVATALSHLIPVGVWVACDYVIPFFAGLLAS